MGGVSEAIARSARSFGAEIRTNAKVSRVLTSGGQVRGAVLENGEELHGSVGGHHAASEDRVPRPPLARGAARRLRRRHRALEDPQRRGEDQPRTVRAAQLHRQPEFRNGRTSHRLDRDGADRSSTSRRAFQDARVGKPALLPFSDGVIPTTLDKTLNPDGTHIMSLFTQWVPAEWADAPHTEELDAYADRVIDTYDQVAPGFKASITAPRRRRSARDGAGVRPDRRQHLPR